MFDDGNGMECKKPSLHLEWRNLNYYVSAREENNYNFWQRCRKSQELQILDNVSGHLKTGDLVAILGCSGAGKTTLLAAIAQRLRGNLSGDVIVNGLSMQRRDMIRISGFLPQFDINVHTFTAYEHLYFMSHFKMHRKTTTFQKQQLIGDVMLAVGLRDVAHTRIQQLSGGERKRLSLAEELITDPPFLFCDEPTTGLDSYGAYRVIRILRHLCNRRQLNSFSLAMLYGEESPTTPSKESNDNNFIEMEPLNPDGTAMDVLHKRLKDYHDKAILCTIHQPTSDIYELFTHIILMDSGRIIYQGQTKEAKEFFTRLGFSLPINCNPADFYLTTISDSHTHFTHGSLVKSKYDLQKEGLYENNWLQPRPFTGNYLKKFDNFEKIWWPYQVYLLLKLLVIEDFRNLKQGLIGVGLFMITSFTLAIMYGSVADIGQTSIQDIDGSLFMLSNEIIFTFSYGVVYVFPSALPIIRREVGEGTYSLSAYYMAVVLSFVPVAFLKSFLFLSVIYAFIYNQLGIWLYLNMVLILSLSAIAATAYGLFISSIFETEKMSTECAAPFDLIFLIFGGAYYNVDSIPFFKYFSLFFYANEALMYSFWINIDNIECSENVEHPCLKTGYDVLVHNSFRTANYTFWFDSLGLIFISIAFNVIAYGFVRKYVRRTGYY